MKSLFTKTFLPGFLLVLLSFGAQAQYTETFESQIPNIKAFNSNGQPFTITNAFSIYSSRNGIGYNGSKRFIDNVNSPAKSQLNSIKTTDTKLFTLQNFWIFTSADGGENPSGDGTMIITGKLNGTDVFTITKTLGFNSSYGANDGFAYVDLSSEGGLNYSGYSINEVSFQLQGNFDYLAIDNFTWTSATVLPVSVINFSGNYQAGKTMLNWQTSCESNSSHFLIERSSDGMNYKSVARVEGAGNCSTLTRYNTIDENPVSGNNYYRLVAVDFDGRRKQHGVVLIRYQAGAVSSGVYPNPAKGNSITLKGGNNLIGKLYTMIDMSGKITGNGIISGSSQSINISSLPKGNYILKLSDGEVIQWIKN